LQLIHRDIEVGQIVVDAEKPHFGSGGTPVRDMNPANAAVAERLDHAAAGCKIRD
jgi:hypothetical protein